MRASVHEGTRYLVPRDDGHVLVGATIEEVGFDCRTVDEDIARRAFNEVCGELDNARWIAVEGEMDHAIRALSLSYDLTIVERISEEQGPLAKALNTALFETGSPVLVTPPTAPTVIGNVVALIWTGTAQSARAMRSMPARR